jgi:predicted small secreted protein
MKKIAIYGTILVVSLSLTGCFASANGAKVDLDNTGKAANSAQASNEDGSSAVKSEISITDKSKYKSLTTPKW